MTPEGKVKASVKKLLDSYAPFVWYFMPVQRGLGCKRGVPDFIGLCNGAFFAIETKAPGKKPTQLQQYMMEQIRKAGGDTFTVDDAESLGFVKEWLMKKQPIRSLGYRI